MTSAITTLNSTGTVAATTASGTAIATLSHTTQVTQAGVYRCTAYAVIGSGPGVNDTDNIVVSVGSSTLTLPVQPVAGSLAGPIYFDVTLDGSTDIVAKVGAQAAVASYSVTLTADYRGRQGGARR